MGRYQIRFAGGISASYDTMTKRWTSDEDFVARHLNLRFVPATADRSAGYDPDPDRTSVAAAASALGAEIVEEPARVAPTEAGGRPAAY